MELALGIDIGGTTCGLGLVDGTGRIVAEFEISTQAKEGGQVLIGRLLDAAAELAARAPGPLVGVGVGSAGQIDFGTGTVINATASFPGWAGTNIKHRFAERFGLPAWVDNDANVVALAEQQFGAGQGATDLVCLTLGTGIGGGVISAGQMVRGKRGSAGELGHMVVEIGGRPCPCGHRGCIEAYASATAIRARATAALTRTPRSALAATDCSSRAVFTTAAAGDALAAAIVRETARYLGAGLISIICAFDPEVVLIGGGVAQAGEQLLAPVRAEVEANPVTRGRAKIGLCQLGVDAGVIGAAAQVFAYGR